MKKLVAIFLVGMGILLSFPQSSGAQWVKTTGPTGCGILALAVSGANLFAGTCGDGVFLSKDNSASWTAINSGWPADTRTNFLFVSGGYLFAGTSGRGVLRLPLSEISLIK